MAEQLEIGHGIAYDGEAQGLPCVALGLLSPPSEGHVPSVHHWTAFTPILQPSGQR